MNINNEPCLCGDTMKPKHISHLFDFGSSVLVIRNVPVLICEKCGYKLFDDVVVENLERMKQKFKNRNGLIDVEDYSEAA